MMDCREGNPSIPLIKLTVAATRDIYEKIEIRHDDGDIARPFASVVTMAFADGGVVAKVPLAPDAGAVNVTDAPLTGFESLSTTVATSGAANAAATTALCPDPLVGVIDAPLPLCW